MSDPSCPWHWQVSRHCVGTKQQTLESFQTLLCLESSWRSVDTFLLFLIFNSHFPFISHLEHNGNIYKSPRNLCSLIGRLIPSAGRALIRKSSPMSQTCFQKGQTAPTKPPFLKFRYEKAIQVSIDTNDQDPHPSYTVVGLHPRYKQVVLVLTIFCI